MIDTDNPIVKLCVAGMKAELENKTDAAKALFEKAWSESRDDYEKCIAAHYLARHQADAQAIYQWNKESLERAEAVGDERIKDFYPSLHLNLGHSCETLGEINEAEKHYEIARDYLKNLPDSPYKEIVQNGIDGGFNRIKSKRAG